MIDLERYLAAEYESALDEVTPPSSIDLDQARSRGRHLRWRRQTLAFSSAIGAAGVVALLVVTVLPNTPTGGATQAAGGLAALGPVPEHDPLAVAATYGWLPDGVQVSGAYAEHDDIDTTHALIADSAQWKFFLAAGDAMDPKAPCAAKSLPQCNQGPMINGHASSWSTGDAQTTSPTNGLTTEGSFPANQAKTLNVPANFHSFAGVTFQDRAGRTASLSVSVPGGKMTSAQVATIVKVAENVSVVRYQAVAMPFHVPQLSGWESAIASGGAWPDMHFTSTPLNARLTFEKGRNSITIELRKASTTFEADSRSALPVATSPTSIDGHQAMRSSDSGSEVLKVHDVNGFDVSIAALGPDAVQKIDSLGGLVGYFHAMTVYQTDPNTWTTDVVG